MYVYVNIYMNIFIITGEIICEGAYRECVEHEYISILGTTISTVIVPAYKTIYEHTYTYIHNSRCKKKWHDCGSRNMCNGACVCVCVCVCT